jgi:hypothetical protein
VFVIVYKKMRHVCTHLTMVLQANMSAIGATTIAAMVTAASVQEKDETLEYVLVRLSALENA